MKYDVDYFIQKFEAIPERLWLVGGFSGFNKNHEIACCAAGHCGLRDFNSFEWERNSEASALYKLPFAYGCSGNLIGRVTKINDGQHSKYQQTTPKQRVLAALKDIKNGTVQK